MSTQDLYGFRSDDLEAARASAKAALGLELDLHDGSYREGDYHRKNTEDKDEIVPQINDDGEGGAEEDYKDFKVQLKPRSGRHQESFTNSPSNGQRYRRTGKNADLKKSVRSVALSTRKLESPGGAAVNSLGRQFVLVSAAAPS